MSDPAVHVASEVRYRIRILSAPYNFYLRGVEFKESESSGSMITTVRQTIINGKIIDSTIVGIIGGLHRDLVR